MNTKDRALFTSSAQRSAGPATAAGTVFTPSVPLTGNFSTDFDRWGTDFSTALTVQQSRQQLTRLERQLEERDAALAALRSSLAAAERQLDAAREHDCLDSGNALTEHSANQQLFAAICFNSIAAHHSPRNSFVKICPRSR